ncbi:MAG: hypothetical protein GF329_06960 [Candidatus Lokiarchaeota archaeon]|nr:hypothetical protein [Candidatus Lokiarchaeota archaeon]
MVKKSSTELDEKDFEDLISDSEISKDYNLKLEEFIVLFFGFSPDNKIKGRTRFQKLIYLLNNRFNIFNKLKYFRYYYGPFSRVLESAVDNLKIFDYINEEIIYLDIHQTKYQINRKLSNKGLELFKNLKNELTNNQIGAIKEMINYLENENYYTKKLSYILEIVYKMAGYKK